MTFDNNITSNTDEDTIERSPVSHKILERGFDAVMKGIPKHLIEKTKEKMDFCIKEIYQENNKVWKFDGNERKRLDMYIQNDDVWMVRKCVVDMN